jgi:hypothetical protein
LLIIGGIFTGGTLWWITITGMANLFRHKFTLNTLYWANRVIGLAVIIIGVVLFLYLQSKQF